MIFMKILFCPAIVKVFQSQMVFSLKKMCQIIILNLFTLGWKVENKDFVHIFADPTKVKIPSEINCSLHISKKYLVKTPA